VSRGEGARRAGHSHHAEGKPGTACVDCHMPKAEFARMVRSDHSMRPPAPAATVAFKSPNACNLCHKDKEARWSDRAVRAWHTKDYQAPVLRQAALIEAARKGDWSELAAMLAAVGGAERDEVMAVALIRLLRSCPSDGKWPAILAAMHDRSPWVRAAAAETAGDRLSPEAVAALLKATRDPLRLPRVRAANALAGLPASAVPDGLRADLEAAAVSFWRRSPRVPTTSPPNTTSASYTRAGATRRAPLRPTRPPSAFVRTWRPRWSTCRSSTIRSAGTATRKPLCAALYP